MEIWSIAGLLLLGLLTGCYGTLIGAGGGFVLLPVLLLLYPQESLETLTSISLAVVFFNALSGTYAYAVMKRVDFKSGLWFSVTSVPGAVIGALVTPLISRWLFATLLGGLLVAACLYLLFSHGLAEAGAEPKKSSRAFTRAIVDASGTLHTYVYNPVIGMGLSFLAGFFSSLLGIGGGIIHVPALVYLLHFPVHIATATSHFILANTALTGTVTHILAGSFSHGIRRTICLAIGVMIGAQLGAMLSNRIKGPWIIRSLAVALGFVGVRILLQAWT